MIANHAMLSHKLLHSSLPDCFQLRVSLKLAVRYSYKNQKRPYFFFFEKKKSYMKSTVAVRTPHPKIKSVHKNAQMQNFFALAMSVKPEHM